MDKTEQPDLKRPGQRRNRAKHRGGRGTSWITRGVGKLCVPDESPMRQVALTSMSWFLMWPFHAPGAFL